MQATGASSGIVQFVEDSKAISEILSGKGDYFPGLMPLIYAYDGRCESGAVSL